MQTNITTENPFLFGRLEHGYAWEMVRKTPNNNSNFSVLDYGGYDGHLLETFINSGVVNFGTTIDMNADIVEFNAGKMHEKHQLIAIKKGEQLPFADNSFDLITIMGVIEHVHDQNTLLAEINRVLKKGGDLIVAVPGKHIFSFLDFGNWKFLFPKTHKWYIEKKFGKSYYFKHFIECANGLIGDVEVEKSWHEHFTHVALEKLLNKNKFEVYHKDGFGLFYRIFHNIKWIFPFTSPFMNYLIKIDSKCFSQAELFCTAKKK
jgi:ubiquinone/menaquinone biosynthesis C-methylase UbiE